MIVRLAELASMNALWKLFLKVISTRSIPKPVQTVVPVQMFARWKQSILNNRERS